MTNPTLTFAVSHYDRYVPFFDGSVQPTGFELKMLHVGQSEEGRYGQHRHERMLQKGEFDICELSLSSYLMARERKLPFTAIPVFPRRLFKPPFHFVFIAPHCVHVPLEVRIQTSPQVRS